MGSKRTTQKIEHKYIGNKSSKKRALDRYAMGLDDESSSSSDGDSE